MNFLSLSTSRPEERERILSSMEARWSPYEQSRSNRRKCECQMSTEIQKWQHTWDMRYPYLFTAYFSNWSKQEKVASSRVTHGLFWNSASRTHVKTLTLHVRLMIFPVTGSASIPSTDNLALQAFVQTCDRHSQLPLQRQVQTEARAHLESRAPRDSQGISPAKKHHIAPPLSCRSSVAFLCYAHKTQSLTHKTLNDKLSTAPHTRKCFSLYQF